MSFGARIAEILADKKASTEGKSNGPSSQMLTDACGNIEYATDDAAAQMNTSMKGVFNQILARLTTTNDQIARLSDMRNSLK